MTPRSWYNGSMSIHLLPPDVASKIAAGEVVERPANVIKELVENSIDAGATEIRVEVREGGRRLLRVSDNGEGIRAAEAALAFERHATSKLATFDDLSRIGTFGFRGEALYSIAAVSRLTLTTRYRGDETGVQLRLAGGVLEQQGRAGAPVGTVVNVEQLFYNVPARQKFLRTPAAEAGQIAAVMQRFALAHPDRRFALTSEGRLLLQTSGSGSLFDVLVKIYGLENARQMVRIGAPEAAGAAADGAATDGTATDGADEQHAAADIEFMADVGLPAPAAGAPGIDVAGYVSLPSLTRSNRSNIELFVNRRAIEDRALTQAVIQAYHTLLPVGRYPVAVLFITIDPAEVDVNVHPQKTQVRFHEDRRVCAAVQKVVRRAVVAAAPAPDVALDAEGRLEPARPQPGASAAWFTRRDALVNIDAAQRQFDLHAAPPVALGDDPVMAPADLAEETPAAETHTETHPENATGTPMAASEGERAGYAEEQVRSPQLPPLRVVGQIGATYIVAEGPEGMFLIDQHAAHERILYEKYLAQRYGTVGGAVPRQALLEPLPLHIGSRLAGLVAAHLLELQHLGFDVEPFGGDTFLVRAAPAALAGEDPLRVLEEIAAGLAERRNQVGKELEDALVKMVCKRAAIKAGQMLSDIEMRELVRQLEECQSPRTCPHGRPTVIQLPAIELEKAFGRI